MKKIIHKCAICKTVKIAQTKIYCNKCRETIEDADYETNAYEYCTKNGCNNKLYKKDFNYCKKCQSVRNKTNNKKYDNIIQNK